MAVITIIANGITLDFVKETLTIKKENNAFSTNFKVSYSSFPFLIIENQKTRAALGTRDITSVRKKLVTDVVVLEMGQRYTGRLQVVNYERGYRKCNLMYGSDALQVLEKKLSDLLPTVSIDPAVATPPPYTETGTEVLGGQELWQQYPLNFNGKIFPEVNFGFPQMAWRDKYFTTAPEPDDVWYLYNGWVNAYSTATNNFAINSFTIDGENVDISNLNTPMPQLFLLGILKLAFATIGYTIAGAFVEDQFIRRLQVLSLKDNLCAVEVGPNPVFFNFNDFVFVDQFGYNYYKIPFTPTQEGEYSFAYTSVEPFRTGNADGYMTSAIYYGTQPPTPFGLNDATEVYRNWNDPENLFFTGTFTIIIDTDQVGQTINIYYMLYNGMQAIPPNFFRITRTRNTKTFQMMHPTIPLGRYAPDMSLSTFINEVKNLFCLDVRFDDHARVVSFNFTKNILQSAAKVVSGKSLATTDEAPAGFEAIVLKYANAVDNSLYIDKAGATLNRAGTGDLVEIIESRFKTVTHDGNTANLSGAADKEGTGLLIYNPVTPQEGEFARPLIAPDYNGQTLNINGALGIYSSYWRAVIQLRLNGSVLEMEGPFTEQELTFLDRYQKIHINHQEFIITSLNYNKTRQDNYLVKFNLLSVTV